LENVLLVNHIGIKTKKGGKYDGQHNIVWARYFFLAKI